jgi:tryptophanyl-tRNA synthetase
MIAALAPVRERAAELKAHPERVREVLEHGAAHCRQLAGETMARVRDLMGFVPPFGKRS